MENIPDMAMVYECRAIIDQNRKGRSNSRQIAQWVVAIAL
jgi:hypothetical protein